MHDRQLITHNTEKVFTHNDRIQEERSKKKNMMMMLKKIIVEVVFRCFV